MQWLGDYKEDDTLHFLWSTNAANGASITRATNGEVRVYKDNGVSQTTTGVTDTEDFDSLTGVHACTIDLSADAFFAVGADYSVVLQGATIDGQTVNAVLAHFSIENRFQEVDVVKLLGTAWLTPGVAGTPDVNAKLLGGTAQTGNDVGADVNSILEDTGTTLDTLIKDIPTVAEFELRTILAADYVVVGDTIAGVTAVTNDVGITQAGADKVRASVCVTGDPANSIGKVLYEIYINRLTSARAGYLANINNANLATIADISTLTATEIAYLNASISSRSSHNAAAIWSVGTRALTDKAGFSLAAAGITAIWEKNISAFSGAGYAGTYVKTLYDDWINGGRLDNLLDAVYTGTPPTVGAIADQVWDEVLTGATHNAATSAGRRLRQAADVMIIREETCQAGGGNDEVILDVGASATSEFYINDLIVLTSGTGVGQQRHIDSYVGATKTVTVNRDWTTNPDATTNFVIKADSTKHVHGFETAAKAEIESEVNDALVALKLDHLIAVADGDDPVNNSIIAILAATDGDWSKFAKGTDALQAIRDRGDSAWVTGAGGDATATNQTTIINHLTDVKGTNFVKDTHSLKQILDLIQRTLGLTQENHYIDNTTFTTGKLTAARIRIYSVAGSVGTAADVIATYNIAATYDANGNMETYKVTKA